MSNRLYIDPTEFKNLRTGHVDQGFIANDSYASTYFIVEGKVPEDDLEFLKMAIQFPNSDEAFRDMLAHVEENQKGVFVGSNYYEWDKIEDFFNPEPTIQKMRQHLKELDEIYHPNLNQSDWDTASEEEVRKFYKECNSSEES